MNIENLRPQGAGGAVATFDIEIVPGLTLKNWELRKSVGGEWRTYCPATRHGTPSAIIDAEVRDAITAAAASAFGGQAPHAAKI